MHSRVPQVRGVSIEDLGSGEEDVGVTAAEAFMPF